MTDYLYAPKDDPLHRERWREPYDADVLARLRPARRRRHRSRVGFAISPGLSIDYGSATDRADLAAKVDQVVALGITTRRPALDDIPVRPAVRSRPGTRRMPT